MSHVLDCCEGSSSALDDKNVNTKDVPSWIVAR